MRATEVDKAMLHTNSIPFSVPTVSKSKKFWSSPAPTHSQTAARPLNNSLCVSGPEGKETAPWVPVPLPLSTEQSSYYAQNTTSLPVVSAFKLEETMPKMRREGKLQVSASSLKVAFDDEHEHVVDSAPQQPQRRLSMRNRK